MDLEKIYTILEINTVVKEVIKEQFPQSVWVCGEIQGLRPDRGKKHIYFELVQKAEKNDSILAKVKVALFAWKKPLIDRRIKEANGAFELRNDIEVKFLCEVSLHPPTGNYSLVVVDVDTVYTSGKIAQTRKKIIEDLRKRGFLDKNKEKNIPLVPLKIGLITAYDSAAFHDFTNELKTSGYGFKVLTVNCHMQGKQVEADVLGALCFFNSLPKEKLDVVVISRGGGSTADLSYFDNKKIAEKIAGLGLPVMSALGHQIDTTVTDVVSHTVCKTPTKAAQVLVERVRDFMEKINSQEAAIVNTAHDLLLNSKRDLQNLSVKIEAVSLRYFRIHLEELLNKKHNILNSAKLILEKSKERLKYMESKVKILNPKNILKRGYSITFKDKKPIKSVGSIEKGDLIRTIFYDGGVTSKVENKQKGV